jgi:hypothetical protein
MKFKLSFQSFLKPEPLLRIIITLILFIYLKLIKAPLIYIVISLFFVDYLDCDFWVIFYKKNNCNVHNSEYQIKDKMIDLITYYYFILLFNNYFDKYTNNILIVLLIWRTIGVYNFIRNHNKKYLLFFFDGLNGIIFLFLLSTYYPYIKINYNKFIIIVLLLKILFEVIVHNNVIC